MVEYLKNNSNVETENESIFLNETEIIRLSHGQ